MLKLLEAWRREGGIASRRAHRIRLLTEITSTLLFVQFLLGMWTNLFVSFPEPIAGTSPFEQIFTRSPYVLAIHLVLGLALFGIAIAVLAFASLARVRKLIVTTGVGLASIALAGVSGLIFVFSGYQADPFSFLMAVGFILAIGVYSRVFIQVSALTS